MRIRIPAEVQAKSRVTELGEVSIPGSFPNADHSTDPGAPATLACCPRTIGASAHTAGSAPAPRIHAPSRRLPA
ncbi:unnamed protein product [Rangifer tarandus platyrhynchus]|uniref:Uncharacterized protein n=1 Tax=Rangifer tarandus platyrhynchus TaxID=3082113 RepID=A0AC59Z2N9_RANTA